jgi:hypothetical protein
LNDISLAGQDIARRRKDIMQGFNDVTQGPSDITPALNDITRGWNDVTCRPRDKSFALRYNILTFRDISREMPAVLPVPPDNSPAPPGDFPQRHAPRHAATGVLRAVYGVSTALRRLAHDLALLSRDVDGVARGRPVAAQPGQDGLSGFRRD